MLDETLKNIIDSSHDKIHYIDIRESQREIHHHCQLLQMFLKIPTYVLCAPLMYDGLSWRTFR